MRNCSENGNRQSNQVHKYKDEKQISDLPSLLPVALPRGSACPNAFLYENPVCVNNGTLHIGDRSVAEDMSCSFCDCPEGWEGVDCGRCSSVSVCPDKTINGTVSFLFIFLSIGTTRVGAHTSLFFFCYVDEQRERLRQALGADDVGGQCTWTYFLQRTTSISRNFFVSLNPWGVFLSCC